MEGDRGQKGELVLCARMSSGARSFQLLDSETHSLHTVCLGLNFAPLGCVIIIGDHSWARAGAIWDTIAEEGHLEKDAGGI